MSGSLADFFCIQEIKCQKPIISLPGYYQYWNFSKQKGYSGTAIFTKHNPLSVSYGFNNIDCDLDIEGRIITLEYASFYLITIYSPTFKMEISRINYRMDWERLFFKSSPGIDGERWIKSSDKMKAALSLSHNNYKSKPYKRFVINDVRSN